MKIVELSNSEKKLKLCHEFNRLLESVKQYKSVSKLKSTDLKFYRIENKQFNDELVVYRANDKGGYSDRIDLRFSINSYSIPDITIGFNRLFERVTACVCEEQTGGDIRGMRYELQDAMGRKFQDSTEFTPRQFKATKAACIDDLKTLIGFIETMDEKADFYSTFK